MFGSIFNTKHDYVTKNLKNDYHGSTIQYRDLQ